MPQVRYPCAEGDDDDDEDGDFDEDDEEDSDDDEEEEEKKKTERPKRKRHASMLPLVYTPLRPVYAQPACWSFLVSFDCLSLPVCFPVTRIVLV